MPPKRILDQILEVALYGEIVVNQYVADIIRRFVSTAPLVSREHRSSASGRLGRCVIRLLATCSRHYLVPGSPFEFSHLRAWHPHGDAERPGPVA